MEASGICTIDGAPYPIAYPPVWRTCPWLSTYNEGMYNLYKLRRFPPTPILRLAPYSTANQAALPRYSRLSLAPSLEQRSVGDTWKDC